MHCRPRALPAQPCSKVPTRPDPTRPDPTLPPSPPPGQQLCLLPLEATAHVSLRQPPLRRLGVAACRPPSPAPPQLWDRLQPSPPKWKAPPTPGKSTQAPAWPATLVARLPPIPARCPSTSATFRARPAGPRAPAGCSLGCAVSRWYKHSSSCFAEYTHYFCRDTGSRTPYGRYFWKTLLPFSRPVCRGSGLHHSRKAACPHCWQKWSPLGPYLPDLRVAPDPTCHSLSLETVFIWLPDKPFQKTTFLVFS